LVGDRDHRAARFLNDLGDQVERVLRADDVVERNPLARAWVLLDRLVDLLLTRRVVGCGNEKEGSHGTLALTGRGLVATALLTQLPVRALRQEIVPFRLG